jgi:hypothetical protein
VLTGGGGDVPVQDGMLKNRETYEIMTPETIGLQRNPEDAGRLAPRALCGMEKRQKQMLVCRRQLAIAGCHHQLYWCCMLWPP